MEYAREERRTNLPSNTKVKKETFSPMLILMMLMYPTRLATFALLIPTPTVPGALLTPTVPGAPLSSDSGTADAGKLRGADDLWETAGAGALVRIGFAFTFIAFVHLFLVCYIVRGPSSASFMETHRNGRVWAFVASIAFWFITTCFLLTYTSMARYARDLEWGFAAFITILILGLTVQLLCAPSYAEKVAVGYPPRAMV